MAEHWGSLARERLVREAIGSRPSDERRAEKIRGHSGVTQDRMMEFFIDALKP
jgi:hypothetical protein